MAWAKSEEIITESKTMKLKAEVAKLENTGNAVKVTLCNIKGVAESEWSGNRHEVAICMPASRARAFQIGRTVTVKVEAS